MSAYQRFLPRHRTRTGAYAAAEVAEVAEVEANQRPAPAEALLKPAEVQDHRLELQQTSAGVQQRQMPTLPKLQQLQQLPQEPAPKIAERHGEDALSSTVSSAALPDQKEPSPGIPVEWRDGVARLATIVPPRAYPAHAWQKLIPDAERFLGDWAQQAAALGWPDWELFGCHKRAPWGRIQGMGLVLLLHGDEIAALTETEAVIRTRTGAHQTYRRKPSDPLSPAERSLVWELS